MKNTLIILGILAAGGMFLYFRQKKKSDVNGIGDAANNKQGVQQNIPAKSGDPILRSVIVPPIPTKYADGTPVPKSVLEDKVYNSEWQKFYQNTIFPPGDPRNTPTPSGGMMIGDGKGGFYDPNQV